MKDRRLHHLGDIRTVLGGARICRFAGGKTNLVIEHNVQRATGPVGARLRHLKGLHDHALPGKGRVTMQHNGNHRITDRILSAILPSANGSLHHRRYDFKV